MIAKPTVVIATTNRGKTREVLSVLGDLPLNLITLADLPTISEPVEDGATFSENAAKKANYYARATGKLALADDSGLEVDALNGAPGIHSAYYSGEQRDNAANNRKLVANLAGVPAARRTARFRCALALANSTNVLAVAEGSLEGVIVDEPRGTNGFGYDSHFLVSAYTLTAAELPPELKNLVSHRGQALRAIRPHLLRIAEK